MAPEEDLKKRVARKLTKRRKEGHRDTMEIPERFKDVGDEDLDYTAPPDSKAYMNQSVFGMITAAGSQVDFNARFDAQSSDEDDELAQSSGKDTQVPKSQRDEPVGKSDKHKRNLSAHKLLRSIPGLGPKSKSTSLRKSNSPTRESKSATEPKSHIPEIPGDRTHSHRDAPVMSRMLEAKAELAMRPSFDLKRHASDLTGIDENGESTSSNLAKRLAEIFEFETAEDVIEGRED